MFSVSAFASSIDIFDATTGEIVNTLVGHADVVSFVCFSPCGTLLASCSWDKSIMIWACDSWECLHTFKISAMVSFVCFNAASDKIVSFAGCSSTVCVWSLETKAPVLEFRARHQDVVCSGSFNRTDDTIAVPEDSNIGIYDSTTGEELRVLSHHGDTVTSVKFSDDGQILISGSKDSTAVLCVAASGAVLHVLRGHLDDVVDVCFDASASRVLTASRDCTARIWDVTTGECLFTLSDHDEAVPASCFSEDGSRVITGSQDCTIRVWDSHTGQELRTVHMRSRYYVSSVSYRPSAIGCYI